MGRARQTVERRQLGLTLRRLRTEAGKSQQDAAQSIGKVRSRIVDLEDGRSAPPQDDLVKLLDLYGVPGAEQETVLALGVEARKRERRRTYTDLLPGAFERFADLEASAVEISSYESGIIPGLLQSPAYARTLIGDGDGVWWHSSDGELEQRITFRLDRQARVWDADRARSFHFVIAEDALHAVVGGREVMREQLLHVLGLMDARSDLCVQVLRSDVEGNPARGGGFTVFCYGHKGPPVGFSNVVFGPSTYFHDEADTAIMLRGFDRLRELSLSPSESRRLIGEIADGG